MEKSAAKAQKLLKPRVLFHRRHSKSCFAAAANSQYAQLSELIDIRPRWGIPLEVDVQIPVMLLTKGGSPDFELRTITTTYKYPLSSKFFMRKGAISLTFETLVYAVMLVVLLTIIGIAIYTAVQRFFQ